MDSGTMMPLSVRPLPRSILELPTEVRLRIYECLYDEITIRCANPQVDPAFTSPSRVSPSSALLLTCRKVYNEVKSYINEAPIAITVDQDGKANCAHFPPHVLRRVRAVSHVGHFLTHSSVLVRALGFNCFDKDICPKLWLIRKLPRSDHTNVLYPFRHGLLDIVLPLLHKPQLNETVILSKSPPDILTAFQAHTRAHWYQLDVDDLEKFLIGNNLTLRVPYKFGMRMLDHGAAITQRRAPKILMERWFTVEVIWDGRSFLIEGLPDFREEAWWKDPTGWASYTISYDGLRHLEIIVCEAPSDEKSEREWHHWYGKSW
ncbi:hypothetical protein H2200_002499 [Cladophialophora chaetospira]|uniref:Uncharacterized protein n=1 Tax=Cladophialophora chaetospira TaxID=386627 RepID=A0AA39CNM2_9EURO|nr:hypothetical protein H2200_002499 [Cladophialophora chaetospira]